MHASARGGVITGCRQGCSREVASTAGEWCQGWVGVRWSHTRLSFSRSGPVMCMPKGNCGLPMELWNASMSSRIAITSVFCDTCAPSAWTVRLYHEKRFMLFDHPEYWHSMSTHASMASRSSERAWHGGAVRRNEPCVQEYSPPCNAKTCHMRRWAARWV